MRDADVLAAFAEIKGMNVTDVIIHSEKSPSIGFLQDMKTKFSMATDYSSELEAGVFETRLVREEE